MTQAALCNPTGQVQTYVFHNDEPFNSQQQQQQQQQEQQNSYHREHPGTSTMMSSRNLGRTAFNNHNNALNPFPWTPKISNGQQDQNQEPETDTDRDNTARQSSESEPDNTSKSAVSFDLQKNNASSLPPPAATEPPPKGSRMFVRRSKSFTLRHTKMVQQLVVWARHEKAKSKSVTGKGLAALVESIAEDGRVTEEDEHVIRQTLYGQQGMWAVIITIDTLILTMLVPLLLADQLEPRSDVDRFSDSTLENLYFGYNFVACMTFFFTCYHILMTTFFYACSSYLLDTESVLQFYVNFSGCISFINLSGFPITFGTVVAVALGQAIIWGPTKSIPAISMASTSLCAILVFYLVVLKPRFLKIFAREQNWDGTM